jgi:hypothetical protein
MYSVDRRSAYTVYIGAVSGATVRLLGVLLELETVTQHCIAAFCV